MFFLFFFLHCESSAQCLVTCLIQQRAGVQPKVNPVKIFRSTLLKYLWEHYTGIFYLTDFFVFFCLYEVIIFDHMIKFKWGMFGKALNSNGGLTAAASEKN